MKIDLATLNLVKIKTFVTQNNIVINEWIKSRPDIVEIKKLLYVTPKNNLITMVLYVKYIEVIEKKYWN